MEKVSLFAVFAAKEVSKNFRIVWVCRARRDLSNPIKMFKTISSVFDTAQNLLKSWKLVTKTSPCLFLNDFFVV